MTEERSLTQLAAALPEYQPRLLPFDGYFRLHLTFAASESVEVYALDGHPNYWVVQTVKLEDDGVTHKHFLATVYGIALIPVMVREYVTGMTMMRSR